MPTIEIEARFFLPDKQIPIIRSKLVALPNTTFIGNFHEETIMYDNPNPSFTFYTKEVDGRLRIRLIKILEQGDVTQKNKILVSWNRRLHQDDVNSHAEESEFELEYDTRDNLLYIFEKVLKCPRISSYERERALYTNTDVRYTVDKFPYGCMLEIESLHGSESDIELAIQKLKLSSYERSALSCDDKYNELCKLSGITPKADILFSDTSMPSIS